MKPRIGRQARVQSEMAVRLMNTFRSFLLEGECAGSRFILTSPTRLQRGSGGNRLGKSAGSSLEFLDHREYQPGDDIRRINWQALARSDRLSVKLFREEVTPHLDLLIDTSRSMALPDSEKARGFLGLIALLTQAARNADFTCVPWQLGASSQRVRNGHHPPSAWEELTLDYSGDAVTGMVRQPPALRPMGMRLLVSDLLVAGDPAPILQFLAHQAALVVVVQVLAEKDLHPELQGNLRLHDCESGHELEVFLDQSSLVAYRAKLSRHLESWQIACRRLGACMVTLVAEQLTTAWEPSELVRQQLLAMTGVC